MCHFPLDLRSWTISKEFEKLAVNKHNCKETECLAIYPASKQAGDQPLALKAVETMSRLLMTPDISVTFSNRQSYFQTPPRAKFVL